MPHLSRLRESRGELGSTLKSINVQRILRQSERLMVSLNEIISRFAGARRAGWKRVSSCFFCGVSVMAGLACWKSVCDRPLSGLLISIKLFTHLATLCLMLSANLSVPHCLELVQTQTDKRTCPQKHGAWRVQAAAMSVCCGVFPI